MSEKSNGVPSPADFFGWLNQFVQPAIEAGSQLGAQSPLPLPATTPLQMWKSMTEYNQQAWSQFLKGMVGTPEFAAGLGRSASQSAVVRDGVRRAAKAYLEAANMPSRDDHTRLAGQVVALDAKLDDVEDMLKDGEVDQLSRRLEGIIGRLDKLEQQSLQPAPVSNDLPNIEAKLTALNSKLDRLVGLETRLSRIETTLNHLTTVNNPPATEAKPETQLPAAKPKAKGRSRAKTPAIEPPTRTDS